MIKFSTLLSIAAMIGFSALSAGAETNVSSMDNNFIKGDFLKVTHTQRVQESVETRGNVKVSPQITNAAGDHVNSVWCVTTIDGQNYVYGMEDWEDGDEFAFYVPEGTYDFFAFGYTYDKEGTIIITKEDVVVDADFSSIQFDSSDAVYSSSLSYYTPSGESVSLPSNTYRLDNIAIILYEGDFIFFANNTFFSDAAPYVKSNFQTGGRFEYVSMDFAATQEGMLNYVVPVSFTEENIEAGKTNWQTAEIQVAETPVNIIKEVMEGEDDDPYTCATYIALKNGEWMLSANWGIFGKGYDASKVGLWEPENYTGDLSFAALPRGAVMKGFDSCINGLPLQRGKDGLEQMGVNYAFDNDLVFTHNSYSFENENPMYSGKMIDGVFGNCAPSLFTAKYWDRIRFNFIGRYGEAMNIDSWYDYFSAENYFPTYTVKLTLNGNLITDDQVDYGDYEWEDGGLYTVEVTTENVLIDESINGSTTGIITFDTETFENVIPSVSVLSFLNKSTGELTDRFENASDGTIALWAAGYTFEVSDVHNYVNYLLEAPKEVKIEYAPMGSDNFEELEVTNFPEDFFTPGYGAYYEASLSDVKTTSENDWYDLRITVISEYGASQVQEISPAFKLTMTSGIETIGNATEIASPVYFNLQGQKVVNPQKGEIIIMKKGNQTQKIVF